MMIAPRCALLLCIPLAASAADMVYRNGKIITVSAARPLAEAMLVRDGRIAAVGSNQEVLAAAAPGAERSDLRGRTVVPGLIDSHTHPLGAGLAEADNEIPVLTSIGDVQGFIRNLVKTSPPGRLVFVPKVYSTRMKERRYPTRYELDEVSAGREAMTDNSYASVLNSALLKRLGVTRDTPQPANGKIIKDAAGEPTGLILGAQQLLGPLRASRTYSEADRLRVLRRMHEAYNRAGITSTIDRGQRADGMRTYQELRRRGEMTVRTTVTYLISAAGKPADVERELQAIPLVTGFGDEWLRVGPVKTVVDGGILIGTAYLREPYGEHTGVYGYSDPDYRGVVNVSRENLAAMAKTAARLGWQMTAHTTGGGAIDLLLDAYEETDRETPIRGRRFTVTHGNFPDARALERAARMGVIFDVQPQWYHFDAPALAPVFGAERSKWWLPLRAMFDAGVMAAGGSDHMIKFDARTSINAYHPFFAMWMAVTRKLSDGAVFQPAQRITREEALRMWTINGAYTAFEESNRGSLEPGKFADFVVLDRDFATVPEDEIRAIEPVMTVVGGRVVYRNANLLQ